MLCPIFRKGDKMFNTIGDAVLAKVGSVMPQSMINTIDKVESSVNDGIILLKNDTYKYFDGASKKMETGAKIAKEFVKFCQNYIYVPTIILVAVVAIILAFGSKKDKEWAKSKLVWAVFGIAGLMSALTITSIIINFLSPDTSSDLKV